jgi:hypothetical protein
MACRGRAGGRSRQLPRDRRPHLARILETWTLAVLGGDEQCLADLPVSPVLGGQCEHLRLMQREAERGSRRGTATFGAAGSLTTGYGHAAR